jgi:hypothetical protein
MNMQTRQPRFRLMAKLGSPGVQRESHFARVDASPLAIPLQFEVNYLTGNLIALSFARTYVTA